jgi:hypothetical protein
MSKKLCIMILLALLLIYKAPDSVAQQHIEDAKEQEQIVALVGKDIDARLLGKWTVIEDRGKQENESGYIGKVVIIYEFKKDGTCTLTTTGISCIDETKGKKITGTSKGKYAIVDKKKYIISFIGYDKQGKILYVYKEHYNQKENRLAIGKTIYKKAK